jgi:hypothetical protein
MSVQRQPISATGVQGFLQWLKTAQPYLYKRIEKQLPAPQLAGLAGVDPLIGTASTAPTSSTISDILKNLVLGAGQVLLTKEQLKAQQKIVDLQLERARAGLPPADIDPTQYGLPAPSVNIGLAPEAKKMLMIGAGLLGAGFLAYLVFGSGGRRRR